MAMDWRGAVGVGLFRGVAMHLGFRAHGARDACAVRSSSTFGGRGILSLCKKPDVRGLLRGLDGLVGRFRKSEPHGTGDFIGCDGRRCFVCEIL